MRLMHSAKALARGPMEFRSGRAPLTPRAGTGSMTLARRQLLAAAVLLQTPAVLRFPPAAPYFPLAAAPCAAADGTASAAVGALLGLIPAMPFGAPATNATLEPALASQIEAAAVALERLGQKNNVQRGAAVDGSWRLIYSNAREISNLAAGLPLGFALGPTYQPIDLASGRFENQGNVVHQLGLARATTCVVGDVRAAKPRSLNAAGTVNADNNRVDVDFQRITFALEEVLGRPVPPSLAPSLRKIVKPTNDPDAAQPANDITYLDGTMRVTRGGDDGIFVFRREAGARPLLSADERAALFSEGSSDVVTGKGTAGEAANAPPELRKLLEVKR